MEVEGEEGIVGFGGFKKWVDEVAIYFEVNTLYCILELFMEVRIREIWFKVFVKVNRYYKRIIKDLSLWELDEKVYFKHNNIGVCMDSWIALFAIDAILELLEFIL